MKRQLALGKLQLRKYNVMNLKAQGTTRMDFLNLSVTLISLLALIFLILIFALMMYALIFGAPFATVAQNRIETMIELLKLKKGDRLADLGSGDGRIVMAFAKLGIEAHGYEINPVLVAWSRFKIRQQGLEKLAFIHFKDYWQVNLGPYNAVALYGIGHMMKRLEKKISKELKPNSKVVSNYFRFSGLKPKREMNKVLLYSLPRS